MGTKAQNPANRSIRPQISPDGVAAGGKTILASSSPFRAELLRNAGLAFEVRAARIDERAVERPLLEQGVEPREIALRLAVEKAGRISRRFAEETVIGADQILELDGKILHKPESLEQAKRRLAELSGRVHHLHSAACILRGGEVLWSMVDSCEIRFRDLDCALIDDYLRRAGPEALETAGACQIEGMGIQLIQSVKGDFFSIIGMPMLSLLEAMRSLGRIEEPGEAAPSAALRAAGNCAPPGAAREDSPSAGVTPPQGAPRLAGRSRSAAESDPARLPQRGARKASAARGAIRLVGSRPAGRESPDSAPPQGGGAEGLRSAADAIRAFVIGFPVSHSLSPPLHGHWLRRSGIRGTYRAIAVKPEELGAFLERFPQEGFAGGNVTVPHKQAAASACARLDSAAQAIGAVNTLWIEKGELAGSNTDAYGFRANLDDFAPQWREGKAALVLGAGGAARAVCHALVECGYERVHVANRTKSRAEALAGRFGEGIIARGMAEASALVGQADLIVNASSLGMKGQPALDLDLGAARKGAIVCDIVYAPLETPLLRAARRRGLKAVDGLGMLLHQAAPGFERWFGIRPAVDESLRKAILERLDSSAPEAGK